MTNLHHLVQWLTKQGQPAAARAVQTLADVAEMPCQRFVIVSRELVTKWTRCGDSFLPTESIAALCIPCKVRKQLEKL